jgi:ATP-dependent DNA helicase DinG
MSTLTDTTVDVSVDDCSCTPQWPALVATIDGETRAAEPTDDHSAAESAGTASCAGCAAVFPAHWTLTPISNPEKVAKAEPPKTATDLLRLIVAERPNGEVRPQQERMVGLVEDAIKNKTHLLVQAGTGTGKSLGYLIPAIKQAKEAGKRVVVSTATKQLGEQIVSQDMPALAAIVPKVGGPHFDYALIKGRNNYACLREIDSLVRLDEADDSDVQDALFADPTPRENSRRPSADDLKRLNSLLQWADSTQTGDRTEAPAVPDKVWDQISTDAAGCAGKTCPFYDDCFAEQARTKAREVDVVVTNHAQVAQDLRSDFPLLGEYDVLITDEVHELESYLSSAWGLEVAPSSMKHHVAQAVRKMSRGDKYEQARETGAKVLEDFDALDDMLAEVEAGLQPELPRNVAGLLVEIAKKLRALIDAFDLCAGEKNISAAVAAERKGAGQKITEMCQSVVAMCGDMSDGSMVRWLESGFGNRGPVLKVAPLWIGPKLMTLLGEKTLIATSATITVGGSFDSFIRTLALREDIADDEGETHPPRDFNAVDVGTPFDYDKQAILYIPDNTFPAPVGQERFAHTEAVQNEVTALVKAAGGRTLALFTTRKGAEAAAAHLRMNVDTPVLCQGDAPPSQLIAEFKEDETATLCATMGFWHGVDAPGSTLMCVIMDKVPFAPMNDPLMSARRTAVDNERPGRGFDEVYVAGAAVMLSQGVGRLIRTANDKGVVAILDNRLNTKGYGRTMIASMPPMRRYDNRTTIEGALTRLAAAAAAASPAPTGSVSAARQTAKTAAATQAAQTTTVPRRKAAPKRASTRAIGRSTKKST